MSPSVGRKSSPIRSKSPTRARRSPHRRSPKSSRERSPTRHRSSRRSPIKEKENPSTSRGRSPKRPRSRSPVPHTKHGNEDGHEHVQRSREHHKERHRERGVDREILADRRERSRSPISHTRHKSEEEHELRRSREHHKERHSETIIDREVSIDRSERRSVRETKNDGSLNSRSRHKRSASPVDVDRSIGRDSGSPSRFSRSRVRNEVASPRGDDQREENDSVAIMKATAEALEAKKKEQPSFELSGKLADETNRVRGVTLLHTEPSEARKPDIRWRLYVFKAGDVLNEPLYIHRQSSYLFGRERRVADVPTDHPSCSKQHAVIQFRQVEKEQPDGMLSKQVRPYLMDLGSTNGTFLNENRIESERYYELFEKDTIKFGNSSREYVILHENSA